MASTIVLGLNGEPICETPALSCLMDSGLEVLYMGGYRISKPQRIQHDDDSIPVTSLDCVLNLNFGSGGRGRRLNDYSLIQGTRKVELTSKQADILFHGRGIYSIQEIASRMANSDLADIRAEIHRLQDLGVIRLVRKLGS